MHKFLRAFSTGGAARRARLKVPASLRGSHSHGAQSRSRPRQAQRGCTVSVVSAHRADGAHSEYSHFVATPHSYRESVPVRVSCSIRGSMGSVPFATGLHLASGCSSRLRRGKLQKLVVWGLTKRCTGRAGTFLRCREHRRGAPVTLLVRPQALSAACTSSFVPSRPAVMRVARDSKYQHHSVAGIRTARCRASAAASVQCLHGVRGECARLQTARIPSVLSSWRRSILIVTPCRCAFRAVSVVTAPVSFTRRALGSGCSLGFGVASYKSASYGA
jgi:hypothetical protein